MVPDGNVFFFPILLVSNHGLQNSGEKQAFFEVLGEGLGYFGGSLEEFWGSFPLCYAI